MTAKHQLKIYFGSNYASDWYVFGRNVGSTSYDTWMQWDVGSMVVLATHHKNPGQFNDALEFTQIMVHSTIDEALRK